MVSWAMIILNSTLLMTEPWNYTMCPAERSTSLGEGAICNSSNPRTKGAKKGSSPAIRPWRWTVKEKCKERPMGPTEYKSFWLVYLVSWDRPGLFGRGGFL